MFEFHNAPTTAGHWPILDDEVLSMDEDTNQAETLRAQLSPQEAAEWTRVCVSQHLI